MNSRPMDHCALALYSPLLYQLSYPRMALQLSVFCLIYIKKNSKSQKKKMPPLGIAPRLSAPQAEVLLLYYGGALSSQWRIRVSIPVLNLAKVVCYHVQQSPFDF